MVAPDPDQQTDPRADNHRCRIAFRLPQRGIANADTKAIVEQAKSSSLRGGDSEDQPLLRTPLKYPELPTCTVNPMTREPNSQNASPVNWAPGDVPGFK